MFKFFRKNAKWILISVVVVFFASVFYGLGYQSLTGKKEDNRGVIARINGKPVDLLRFNQILNTLISRQPGPHLPQDLLNLQSLALGQSIDFALLLGEAKKRQRVSRQELEGTIKSIIKGQNFKNEADLKATLEKNGISYHDFKNTIKEDILVQKLMREIKNVSVSPNDLREVRVRHILIMPREDLITGESNAKKKKEKAEIKAKERAEAILARIKKGESFSALAKQYSDDPGSRNKGGDLGYFALGKMVPEFEEAAFSLKVGEVSGLVKTKYGYHILKLEDTRLKKPRQKGAKLEDEVLAEKKERVFREWFEPIKSKAKIEILEPLLKANDLRFKGKIRESISEFMHAARMQPASPYPYLMLGDTYALLGDKDLAVKQYKKAVEVAPGNVYTYLSLGQAYLAREENKKARESFEKASVIAGENKELHNQLLQIFKKQGLSRQVAREKQVLRKIEQREKLKQRLIEESRKKQATP